jgi:hypothetical protein
LTSHNVFTLFFRNFIAISLECFVVAIQRFVTFVTSFFENRKLIFSRLTLFLLYLYSVFKVHSYYFRSFSRPLRYTITTAQYCQQLFSFFSCFFQNNRKA